MFSWIDDVKDSANQGKRVHNVHDIDVLSNEEEIYLNANG